MSAVLPTIRDDFESRDLKPDWRAANRYVVGKMQSALTKLLRVTYYAPGGLMGSIADLVAWPILRSHLQRSLDGLKRRVMAVPTVRREPARAKRRHRAERATRTTAADRER